MRESRADLERLGATAVAVGFSPRGPLRGLARHLRWPWPFLSDTDRLLYRRLGIGRARLRDVYTAGTLGIYASAAARGTLFRPPVEDTRQLGGDAIVVDGTAVRAWRSKSPDDREPVAAILAALESITSG